MWSVVVLGALAGLDSAVHVKPAELGTYFVLLSLITLIFGSRISVQIPRVRGQISVSDTFVLLCLLLFGTEAAVLLAGADALCSSLRLSKKKLVIAFNVGVFLCSTFLTGHTLDLCFGSVSALTRQTFTSHFVVVLCLMGLLQYVANSGLVAVGVALRAGQPLWQTWRDNFLWTSITYFAGASAAGIIAKLISGLGLYAFLATAPIVAVIYFTYTTYLKNVEEAQKLVEELSRQMAEQERMGRALKESEEHFRNAFDHAVGMALVSPDGRWLQINGSLCSMLGYAEAEVLANSFRAVTHPDDLGAALVNMHQLLEGEVTSYQIETRYVHKEKHIIWVLQSASLVRDDAGNPRHLIFQIQDISDRKRAEEQIHHAAFHDGLTGLPNRTRLAERLSLAVERAKRNRDYRFAVLFADLDRFKVVNDSLGHELGDRLLVDLARRLNGCVRQVDTVARLGGDEFAILLDGHTGPDGATEVAARIQEALTLPFLLDGHEFYTTASIGIAYSDTGYERHEDILRDADTAMYRAKANGKARYEVFNIGMHTRAVEALKLESELRHAIEHGEIRPHYQPIIALGTGTITGFEALARWEHPGRGVVMPSDFIPLAEDTGLIAPLGMSILKAACRQLSAWSEYCPEAGPLTMSVNLSGKQFAEADLVESIRAIVVDTGIEPGCLRLEVTESVVMENASAAAEMLRQLKSLGVQISIDDFGTGYSSLSYLHRFPFDILKIDRSFVGRMSTDRESRGIVKTIIMLATELGKVVVAEGVETDEHRTLLTALACQYGQGYLFSKPLDPTAAEALLKREGLTPSRELPVLTATGQDSLDLIGHVYTM